MKGCLTLLICLTSLAIYAQSFNLTVENGYGGGVYNAGDTVHVWSQEWSAASTFSHWSGDTTFLLMPDEWRTQVIMPAHNITVKANIQALPTGTADFFSFEQIRGKNILKPVYSYFPANGVPQIVVWLWHGTNGVAENWVSRNFEMRQFCNYLVAHNMAIIVTEGEESTLNTDFDGDGNKRYDYTSDTINNVDIANVRAIRDTFINRGKMNRTTPQVSFGYSAGGAFSTVLATVLNWKAGITHNAPMPEAYLQTTQTPILFSMSERDAHPDVGQEGNQAAYNGWQYLLSQGKCSQFYLLQPSPIYPQRFKRIPGITTAESNAIVLELLRNNCVGANGYLTKSPAQIEALIINNPQDWSIILSFSVTIRNYIDAELSVMWASHHFSHDFMAKDVKFIKELCATTVNVNDPVDSELVTIFPNPATNKIHLSKSAELIRIIDLQGKIILQKQLNGETEVEVSHLPNGMYILELMDKGYHKAVKWVKQ